jgi:hypothetical protein
MDYRRRFEHEEPINIQLIDEFEVRHWTIRFGVSLERLLDAIQEVGPFVRDVERAISAGAKPRTQAYVDAWEQCR